MSTPSLYLSGPRVSNFPAFAAAAAELRAAGYTVVDPSRHGADPAKTWTDYLRRDLVDLLGCEAVAVLPHWGTSTAADLEVNVAVALGMRVLPVTSWVEAAEPGSRPGGEVAW